MADATQDDEPVYAILQNPRLRLLIPLTVAFAFLMEQLDSTIITTAIPDMAMELHVTPLSMNLAITSYILSLAVFIPVSSWFADRFGTRRVFAGALALFTIGSGLCGLSSSLPVLVLMRVIQGFGGAMMTPVGRLILLRSFPRSELVTAMTYMVVPAVVGPTIGPLLGGLLTTYASWRWLFYVNVPFGLAGIAFCLRFIGDTRMAEPPRFDLPGFLLCGAGLALLQFGLENVGRPMLPRYGVVLLFAAGAGCLAIFALHALRTSEPALDLRLFKIRTLRVSSLGGGVSRVGINAVPFMLPLMLQLGFGLSPVQSGSLTFVTSLGTLAVRPISATLLRRLGFRNLLTVERRGVRRGDRRLRADPAEHAALADHRACAGVRRRPQHAIRHHQHLDLLGHAIGQTQPQHQPGRCDPAAYRVDGGSDGSGLARGDRRAASGAQRGAVPSRIRAGGVGDAGIRAGLPAAEAG